MRSPSLALALALTAAPALADSEVDALRAELKRLTGRIEVLEQQNQSLEKSLASDRLSENEPEVVTRLKAVEFQTLSMQQQARQIEALEGVSVGASLTGVVQRANNGATLPGQGGGRLGYRGDLSVTLPGGGSGGVEGKIFTHLRFGQGNGLALQPTYTSTVNSTAFQVGGVADADSSFAILAQAWYQLKMPLPLGGYAPDSREHLHFTFGKIDPFLFFDQNVAADDETTKFLNNAFVHNPLLDSGGDTGADAYGFAPGGIVQYVNEQDKGGEWGLSLGVFGSSGTAARNAANFNASLAAPFVIAQAQTATRFNYLPGNYRAYVWRNGRAVNYQALEERHSGFGLSFDQKVDDDLTLFGRYGHQLQGKVRFDRALVGGLELAGNRWGRAADAVGIALGALRTSKDFRGDSPTADADGDGIPDYGYRADGWERLLEVYYRYRINERFELSPDLQYIGNPAGGGGAVKVVGLRARVGF